MVALFQAQQPRLLALAGELDLSTTQAQALMLLDPEDPRPMSDMAATLHCDRSNVTGIVDRLEARGLVERRPGAHDRRVKVLSLTEAGLAARQRAQAPLHEAPPELRALPVARQRLLRDVLAEAVTGEAPPTHGPFARGPLRP